MPSIEQFPDYYAALHNGYEPFPWQSRLAAEAAERGWPRIIDLPTGFGKTSVIEIAVFLLAMENAAARRRIFFVVDRRVVVDEASLRAEDIAQKLGSATDGILGEVANALRRLAGGTNPTPLRAVTLRGGAYRDPSWARDLFQPMVCCSTVDQIGSALLFRGYSASPRSCPIQAAMTAYDSLIFLDEAHLSQPFEQTTETLAQYHLSGEAISAPKVQLVSLSATARSTESQTVFSADEQDFSHPLLAKRYTAPKEVFVEKGKRDKFEESAAERAAELKDAGHKRIAVIVNRVDSSRQVFQSLRERLPDAEVVLFTGRSRPYDRDRLADQYRRLIRSGSDATLEKPVIVVATQCLEAGADFDFEAMVTECASWDALRQRWGRLNRLGREDEAGEPAQAKCWVICRGGEKTDPIYGDSLNSTFAWLEEQMPKESKAGLSVSLEALAGMAIEPARKETMLQPRAEAPVLLPAYLDHLVHTSARLESDLHIPLFLHGPSSGLADVHVVWRADLQEGDTDEDWIDNIAINPPVSAEALPLTISRARRWLLGLEAETVLADVEGTADVDEERGERSRRFTLWKGDESCVSRRPGDIRPGDTIVVPADYGGCDEFGWNPGSGAAVRDVGDEAAYPLRRRAILRLFGRPVFEDGATAREILESRTEDHPDREKLRKDLLEAKEIRPILRQDSEGRQRLFAVAEKRRKSERIEWSGNIPDAAVFRGASVGLEAHLTAVAEQAGEWSKRLRLPSALQEALVSAARHHDIGKADPRFQALLQRVPRWAVKQEGMLAKSERDFPNGRAYDLARRQAGYPKGERHEVFSTFLLETAVKAQRVDVPGEFDLVLHLIATHHGYCRPFAPETMDEFPDEVAWRTNGSEIKASTNHRMWRWGSGIGDRFWRMNARFGWYGLAYLEAVLRLSDQKVSEEGR